MTSAYSEGVVSRRLLVRVGKVWRAVQAQASFSEVQSNENDDT